MLNQNLKQKLYFALVTVFKNEITKPRTDIQNIDE